MIDNLALHVAASMNVKTAKSSGSEPKGLASVVPTSIKPMQEQHIMPHERNGRTKP